MKNTQMLIEGALMLAIYIVMLLLMVFVPLTSIPLQLFCILPFLLYSSKYSVKYSILLIIGAVLISFIVGSVFASALAFLFGTLGLMMGYCIRKKESKQIIYISSSIVLLANIILIFVVAAVFFKLNFIDEFVTMYQTTIDQYMDTLSKFGQTPPKELQEQLTTMLNLIGLMTPSLLIGTSFITVIIIMLVNFPILKRLKVDVPSFQPFRLLQFSKSVLWLYLIVLILSLIVNTEENTYMHMALLNAGFILQTLLVIQGLAFIFYFCHIKKWTKAIPILAVVLTFFIPIVLSIVRVLGIIDLGFNLRQLLNKK